MGLTLMLCGATVYPSNHPWIMGKYLVGFPQSFLRKKYMGSCTKLIIEKVVIENSRIHLQINLHTLFKTYIYSSMDHEEAFGGFSTKLSSKKNIWVLAQS